LENFERYNGKEKFAVDQKIEAVLIERKMSAPKRRRKCGNDPLPIAREGSTDEHYRISWLLNTTFLTAWQLADERLCQSIVRDSTIRVSAYACAGHPLRERRGRNGSEDHCQKW
jgi:hypothetical protein